MRARELCRTPLAAASALYGLAVGVRRFGYDRGWLRADKLPVPVISIGNISAGGSGKTPCVAAVARLLLEEGFRPAVVSRGYKGRRRQPVVVVSDGRAIRLRPPEAADEAAMLASQLPGVPVLTGPRRSVVGRAAVETYGVDVIVLDDGFQHRPCARDLDIVLVEATRPPTADSLLPLGRLREPPSSLGRADLVVATRSSKPEDALVVGQWVWGRVPVLRARHVPLGWRALPSGEFRPLEDPPRGRALAFCGLASPDSFRSTLSELKVPLAGFAPYRDHHLYRPSDGAFLAAWARGVGAGWFATTEKDAARLGGLGALPLPAYALAIKFEIVEGEEVWREKILAAARGGRRSRG